MWYTEDEGGEVSGMYRYIRSNSNSNLGIMAFIDTIDAIIFVDDARTFRHQDIRGSDEIDYTNYTDQQLLDLDMEDIQEIVDFDVLDRLAGLRSEDLSDIQLEILKAEYSNQDPLPIDGVKRLLSELQECNTVNVIRSRKNRKTTRSHAYIAGRVLDVIHSLTIHDYAYDTTDFSRGYLKNKLAVFTKAITESDFVNPDNHESDDFIIYIKIDTTQLLEDRSTIVVVSFHEAENGHEPHPYSDYPTDEMIADSSDGNEAHSN